MIAATRAHHRRSWLVRRTKSPGQELSLPRTRSEADWPPPVESWVDSTGFPNQFDEPRPWRPHGSYTTGTHSASPPPSEGVCTSGKRTITRRDCAPTSNRVQLLDRPALRTRQSAGGYATSGLVTVNPDCTVQITMQTGALPGATMLLRTCTPSTRARRYSLISTVMYLPATSAHALRFDS